MSDNTFDSEKKWQNVNSSRDKPRGWVDQGKAKQLEAGIAKSPMQNLKDAWNNITGGNKPKPRQ